MKINLCNLVFRHKTGEPLVVRDIIVSGDTVEDVIKNPDATVRGLRHLTPAKREGYTLKGATIIKQLGDAFDNSTMGIS